MSGDNRKRAIRAIMAETGMKYMAAMRELERRQAAKAEQPAEPAARPEPIGWNVYAGASVRDVTLPPRFIEFIPNEEALAPVAETFAGDVEAFTAEQG